MPSDSKDVRSLIKREPILQAALARGMLNARGAARWLKEEYGLKQKVESIARPIREFDPEDLPEEWEEGDEAIKDGTHRLRSNMALLIIRRSGKTQRRLAELLGALDGPGMHVVRIEPTRRHFPVVVQGDLVGDFQRQLGQWVEEVRDNLVEVSVVTHEPEGSPSPALSAVLQAFHQRNVSVPFATSGPAGITILVPNDDRFMAHDIIQTLTASADAD